MLPNGLKDLYLRVSSEGSLSLAPLSYGCSTVLSVSTDYQGQFLFLTKVWDAQGKTQVLALTLDDNKQLKMVSTIHDDKKKTQQRWVATTNEDVTKDKGYLIAALEALAGKYGLSILPFQNGWNWTKTKERSHRRVVSLP